MRLVRLMLGALALSPFVIVACGGDDAKTVKHPTNESDGGGSASASETSTASEPVDAAVVGVTDTSQQGIENSSGKGAYDDGFKAWTSGDLQTAKTKFREATTTDPKASAAFYGLGCVLERLGDNAGAQMAYRQAFNVKGDNEIAMGAYALNLAHTGHQGEADTFLTDKHQRNPKSARLEASGRTDLAKYAITAVLDGFGQASPARDPGNAEALLLRALIEREAGQRIAAMKDFDAARLKRPDLIEATVQVAAMKLEAGNASEAQPLLESAVKYAPQNAIAHMNLGDCYRLQQRYADAKRELDQSLALDSTLLGAHYAMGLMYLNAPSFPGMDAKSQVQGALRELNQYLTMRGPKAPAGTSDDIDDLIARGKDKLNELNLATQATATATAATPTGDGGKKP